MLRHFSITLITVFSILVFFPLKKLQFCLVLDGGIISLKTRGIAERLQPLDTEVYLCERVAAEAEKLQSLQTILSKFGNVHSVPRILNEAGVWRLNLTMVIETVATLINTKAKKGATSGAMHVAKEAVTAAIEVRS